MGNKGDKNASRSNEQAAFLVATLSPLGEITSKRMFGGNGIFFAGKMFAMVNAKGDCFLKADPPLLAEFATMGSVKHSRMPYGSVPEQILFEEESLIEWARKSIDLLVI